MIANRFSSSSGLARKPRLILEADCSSCGPVFETETDAEAVLRLATNHSSETGHIVILHGTSDLPDSDEAIAGPPDTAHEAEI